MLLQMVLSAVVLQVRDPAAQFACIGRISPGFARQESIESVGSALICSRDFDTKVVVIEGLPTLRELWFEEKGDHRLVRGGAHKSGVGVVNITLSAYAEKTGPCVIGE